VSTDEELEVFFDKGCEGEEKVLFGGSLRTFDFIWVAKGEGWEGTILLR